MKKTYLLLLTVILNTVIFSVSAYADNRSYVWTYEYMTMPKGLWEAEVYATTEIKDINRSNINTVKHWLELEYGLTDRLDLAVYQMWKTGNKISENDTEYDGFKVRARYRFGEKGKFLLDPLVYLEYIRNDDLHKPNVGEAKLILARDIGRVNISYNQILKANLESEGLAEWEYAAGGSYKISETFRFGLESKGSYTKDKIAVGPVVSFRFGKNWMALGSAFGLNERTDDLQVRLIVGIPF
ncbi:MAG: hypothetical protein C4533_00780 [Candidatus Omnitrophota bacterium]|jgi:hypothetical protein|nr:MAG: hypothetical protein C4533_00780 [Candidatus Omnitrophota bacterium]